MFVIARRTRLSSVSEFLDLFYESTSSIVCLTIADDHELAIDDTFADIGVASVDILNRTCNWVVVEFH